MRLGVCLMGYFYLMCKNNFNNDNELELFCNLLFLRINEDLYLDGKKNLYYSYY
jgi:hypothetical protein